MSARLITFVRRYPIFLGVIIIPWEIPLLLMLTALLKMF